MTVSTTSNCGGQISIDARLGALGSMKTNLFGRWSLGKEIEAFVSRLKRVWQERRLKPSGLCHGNLTDRPRAKDWQIIVEGH